MDSRDVTDLFMRLDNLDNTLLDIFRAIERASKPKFIMIPTIYNNGCGEYLAGGIALIAVSQITSIFPLTNSQGEQFGCQVELIDGNYTTNLTANAVLTLIKEA